MTLKELQEKIKDAMRSKDKWTLAILKQVFGECKNIQVNERRDVSEEDVTNMIKRTVKQAKESLEWSEKDGTNQERTDMLVSQIKTLEDLLPKQVSGDELEKLIENALEETGATTKRDMGKVMGALNAATGGNFDKSGAAKILQGKLN